MAQVLRSHARTDVGKVRDHNEDNFLVDRKLGLYVVADGMGGHASGEVASAMAVHSLREALRKDADFIEDFAKGDRSVRPEDIKNLLEAAARNANDTVFSAAQADPDKRGMGTTLTAMMLVNGHGFIAHVGDSRAYLLRGGEVRALTEDHSVINELKRRGKLKPELLEKMQIKNAVTRAVGVFETVEVDTFHFLYAPGDRYMMCSDGLHGYVNDDAEYSRIISGLSEETATQRLIDLANERGGKDNITAIVIDVPSEEADDSEIALGYEALANMPFFRFLEPRELLRVQALAKPRTYDDDEVVMREGDLGESLFVVLRGRVKVLKGDAAIASLAAGDFLGEMSLVDRTPRSASVRAEGSVTMLEISRHDFFKILREEKDIGIKLLWNFVNVLTQRLRTTSSELGAAKEALQAEDLTDALFLDDEESSSTSPSARATQPRVPTLQTPRAGRDTVEAIPAHLLPAEVRAAQAEAAARYDAPSKPRSEPAPAGDVEPALPDVTFEHEHSPTLPPSSPPPKDR